MGAMEGFSFRAMMARFLGFDGNRDLWKAFGYPIGISVEQHWTAYRRQGVGNRIVKAFPQACWRDGAIVQDDAGSSMKKGDRNYSAFTHAWYNFEKEFRIYSALERADRLARCGQFSIIVLGFADSQSMLKPLVGKPKLKYVATYPELMVTISKFDSDPTSERYGMPEIYTVQPARDISTDSKQRIPSASFSVHYSRVLHVVENSDDNMVFGEPCLRPVWNYLLDLEKLVGSSTETFWLNARGGLAIEAAADAKFGSEDLAALMEQAKEYESQLRRVMAVQGATIKLLSASVASPQYNMEMLQALIAGATGIPQRILFGSERGELASSQDENSWESRIDERRQRHCGPMILDPFVEKMIATGNMPAPQGDWWAQWPESSAASPEKEAEIALKRVQALAAYANSSADTIVAPQEIRPWVGLEPEPDPQLLKELEDADDLSAEEEEDEDSGAGGDNV